MKTKLKTAPIKYPITREEAKDHLRIDLDLTEDDTYIDTLIATATQQTEQFLHRRLITQTWYQYLECFPDTNIIKIPFGKLQSVTSLKYKDSDGDETTWTASNYIVDADSDPGEIVLGYEKVWPTATLYPSNPITIEFVCGYGLTGADVPSNIKHGIKLGISDLYENRENQVVVGSANLIELKTIRSLLTPFKIDWF